MVPLWKQFYLIQKENAINNPLPSSDREHEIQSFYSHLVTRRKEQNIPPVFALITGPTLSRPYRMEETKITLGRITPSSRLANVHIGSVSSISHEHCQIEWDKSLNSYVLELLSRNGVKIGVIPSGSLTPYKKKGMRIPLPNPCQIVIQKVPIFFQCFYVAEESEAMLKAISETVAKSKTFANTNTTNTNNSQKKKNEKINPTKAKKMIEAALIAAGGKATKEQITDHIEKHYPDVVSDKKTWKNSIGGILSTNSALFGTEPAYLPSGKRARFSVWILKSFDGATSGATHTVNAPGHFDSGSGTVTRRRSYPAPKPLQNSDSESEEAIVYSDSD